LHNLASAAKINGGVYLTKDEFLAATQVVLCPSR
jgi:hypothetical protein